MSQTARTDDLDVELDVTTEIDLTTASADTDGIVRIADQVLEIARTDPDRVAIVHTHRRRGGELVHERRTYREVSDQAERLAAGLRARGVQEGTLVSFMVPPSFEALVVGVALFRLGATMVGIEPVSHGLRRVTHCLARVGPEVFFGSRRAHLARTVFGWGKETLRETYVVDGTWPGAIPTDEIMVDQVPDQPVGPDVDPADPAVIAFTTGSTGMPKPTVLRHRNFRAMVDLVGDQWGLDEDVVDMPTFPMFWIIALSAGGRTVVPPMDFTVKGPGDADPAALLDTIDELGVGSMFGSPALLKNLSDHARTHGRNVPTLRRIVAGGAEVLGPLYAAVKDVLGPDGELYSNYGATESLPLCEIDGATVLSETWARTEAGEGLCVGPGLPGVQLKIVPATDDDIASLDDVTPLPSGEIGEVIAKSPHISEDYFRDPKSTAANKIADPDGGVWHRLGDVGWLDDQDRLWLGGRRSHRVITAAKTYLPLQVEPVVATHPAVRKAALVGVPIDGDVRAVVCIEREDGDRTDVEVLRSELRELVDRYPTTRGIRAFVVVPKLPVDRRHNAKIDRPALGAKIAARAARRRR
ncbi:AMP-binding protein [Nitriliruptoraceae bacterium ZYF776]|nr:AMP-binding protein [Profundirhabdus halotolerans]